MDAVVVRCGKVVYVGTVVYWKCSGAHGVMARYGKIVHVGSLKDEYNECVLQRLHVIPLLSVVVGKCFRGPLMGLI